MATRVSVPIEGAEADSAETFRVGRHEFPNQKPAVYSIFVEAHAPANLRRWNNFESNFQHYSSARRCLMTMLREDFDGYRTVHGGTDHTGESWSIIDPSNGDVIGWAYCLVGRIPE
ncbi:gp089 [Rhodococcus phage ReqiDocB7]|uniref:gp089 n=1 Tax=Rhodococcus phage ReqiDocB7 TaxID=691966 RepID=UPI0001CDD872|nr:gp089 [Rhodococcus phage ReqiDocB7]ADD80875.1 gp089 [Rhodococcus phage ReqiDocB7]